MVDAYVSGAYARKGVGVRVPPPAQIIKATHEGCLFYFGMDELVVPNNRDSGAYARKGVGVRVPPPAQIIKATHEGCLFCAFIVAKN